MAASGKETEEWRLGIEPGTHEAPEAPEEAYAPRNYSAERLERPLCVVTAEHLGWVTVGVLALASRLVMLGARPLNSAEASHALGELALLRNGPPAGAHLSWIHLLQAALFASVGAGDFKARAIFALSGLLLIASSLGMRRQLGRAGAMAFAGLLVLSPSIAYFSRATDSVVPALAFAVLALAMFLELADEPGRIVAAGLGGAIGLGLASDASALMTALFMFAALTIVGLLAALAGTRVRLQVRVWWTRRKGLFLITTLVAAVVWLGCESGFFTHSPLDAIVAAFRSNLPSNLLHADPGDHRGFTAGLDFYLPILSLYEFFVVFLALIGALSVLTLRVRSRLATAALLWSALAIAFCLWTPGALAGARGPDDRPDGAAGRVRDRGPASRRRVEHPALSARGVGAADAQRAGGEQLHLVCARCQPGAVGAHRTFVLDHARNHVADAGRMRASYKPVAAAQGERVLRQRLAGATMVPARADSGFHGRGRRRDRREPRAGGPVPGARAYHLRIRA